MKYLILLVLCLAIHFPVDAAGAPKARKAAHRVEIVHLPADVFTLTTLPEAQRKGVDKAAVLREFEALSSIQKKEFETSEEFAARLTDAWTRSAISPLKGAIGFVVDAKLIDLSVTYDADAGAYQVKQGHSIAGFCRYPRYLARKKTKGQLCVVGIVDHRTDTYNGQNAFGVSADIDRESGSYVSVSVPSDSPLFKAYHTPTYQFEDTLRFPIERARTYKSADLSMMLVGEIAGIDLIDGEGTRMQPRLDSLFDVSIDNKGLPFKLHGVIYFFRKDGLIVHVRDFRDKP